MRIASITIARGGSRRLPAKNTYLFAGRPLVAHKAWQLSKCPSIDEIIVGSDDDAILAAAKAQGVTTMRRAPEFCDEVSRPWNDVIVDMVSRVEADVILWAHCTNPCIRPETYERAIAEFLSRDSSSFDSLVGVSQFRNHIWFCGRPLNANPFTFQRERASPHQVAADVEPVYYQNGGLFIARREDILKWGYVYGPHGRVFVIDHDEATDIDTLEDMTRAKNFYARQQAQEFRKGR
jgi:CMP-N,N'-diacetyllegionaminic acid synthase